MCLGPTGDKGILGDTGPTGDSGKENFNWFAKKNFKNIILL